uniref:Tc1-like transposase DDE domain-containing protein n=1 Tax=Paramormyrops kingsleyae TaxID=1676925 RepID=A0A3B3S6Z6_9TELE
MQLTHSIPPERLLEPGVPRLEWPALSPDLNPIESLWDQLSHRVEARNSVPQNLNDLRAAHQEEWDAMPQQTISRLVNSLRRRCQAVIDARGFCCGILTTVVGFCFNKCFEMRKSPLHAST